MTSLFTVHLLLNSRTIPHNHRVRHTAKKRAKGTIMSADWQAHVAGARDDWTLYLIRTAYAALRQKTLLVTDFRPGVTLKIVCNTPIAIYNKLVQISQADAPAHRLR